MKCVYCRDSALEDTIVEDEIRIGAHVFKTSMPAQRCPRCGETYISGQSLERFDLLVSRALADQGVVNGAAFKFIRKALGLRAADLADLLGVRPETISRWENDKVPVDVCAFTAVGSLVVDRLQGQDSTLRRLRALQSRGAQTNLDVVLDLAL